MTLSVPVLKHWLMHPQRLRAVRLALSMLLGMLAVAGFAPVDMPLLTLLAVAGLVALLAVADNWRVGASDGFFFGLGLFGLGVNWLGISLSLYGDVPFGFSWLVVAAFVALLSLFTAISGAAAVYWRAAFPQVVWALLWVPVVWTLAEWLRVITWDGFPWLLLGYSHVDTWLVGWAPVGGVLSVSFVVAMTAGLLWWLISSGNWIPGLLMYGVLWGLSGELSKVEWVDARDDARSVALVHGQVSQQVKWQPAALPSLLEAYQRASVPVLGQASVVVWPETAIPTFLDGVMEDVAPLRSRAQAANVQILTGVALREDTMAGRLYFNSIAALDGSVRYDKRHLVPFSEYYPGFSLLSALAKAIGMPMAQFSPGEGDRVQTVNGQAVGMAVCYEIAFGHEMARVAERSDWLLVVSDDGWFYPSGMAAQHWQMVRLRARELGRSVVRVTNQGYTGVALPNGSAQVLAEPADPLQAHVTSVQAHAGSTPYVRWHDMPLLGLMSFVLAFAIMRQRKLRRLEENLRES